jgi:hypothetical protein
VTCSDAPALKTYILVTIAKHSRVYLQLFILSNNLRTVPFSPSILCSQSKFSTFTRSESHRDLNIAIPSRTPPSHQLLSPAIPFSIPFSIPEALAVDAVVPIGPVVASRESESCHQCALRNNDIAAMRRGVVKM